MLKMPLDIPTPMIAIQLTLYSRYGQNAIGRNGTGFLHLRLLKSSVPTP